jgi:hypothetical protein
MKIIIAIALLLIALPTTAQETQGFSIGVFYNNQGTPNVGGSLAYDKLIAPRTYFYSGADIAPIKLDGHRQIKVSPFIGTAVDSKQFGRVRLFMAGAGGIDATESVITGLGKVEAYLVGPIKGGNHWVAGIAGEYSPITGWAGIGRIGLRISK